MAPGPDNRQDLTSLDQNQQESNDRSVINDTTDVAAEISPKDVSSVVKSYHSMIASVEKLEEPATLSTLNERELRALLDEAITYTGSTKDREGKSNLFKELLQEAEVDETEEGRRAVTSSRGLPGSNRRRHKRDSTCERLTHGGSLQNLAQPLNCEFDSSFTYLTSGSSHTYSGGRRKSKKHSGSNVSARQREGGSLPSNVNASHSLASLVNLDLIFDKKRDFCDERTVYYWANKEKSRSLDKPSYGCVTKKDDSVCTTVDASDVNDKKCPKGKYVTNEMIESDDLSSSYKDDSMVNGLNNKDAVSSNNLINSPRIIQSSVNGEDTEGIEMKIIEPRRPVQVISCPTFDTEETSVDSSIEFPLHEYNCKQDKPKFTINGTIQLTTYNNAKCNVTSGTISGVQQNKVTTSNLLPIMHVTGTQPNIAMAVSRLTSQNNTAKDFSVSIDKKSVDDSYNAAQSYNSERKKTRRKHAQEPNVIVYNAENVAGHRNDDIDSLLNFIESKDSKNKKGKTPNGNTIKIKSNTGPKSRSKDKDSKKDQLPSKLQKCNSLEEISKTKLEDLTTEKSLSSSEASSFSSQHGTINGGLLKRTKQRSTGDSVVDSRGDRHSWGSESQSLYCDDVKNEFSSNNSSTRKNSKKLNIDVEPEPEFLVVTKKKKSKRQRRSSSGSRTQNLVNSSSYLSRRRDFVHEYRASHSPEFRRKSACSVPPSDKSDSSDLDSVHSLPVTSNIKHNLINVSLSSVGVPQASYADIARMVTINLPQNSVLHTSPIVPTILSSEKWTDVPAKSPSEPDKFPQDYYPSLDELQQSDRKIKQHNFSNSYLNHGFSIHFDKHSLTDDLKLKKTTESKKAEAHEEAINKKIQVIKYVQEQNNIPVNTNYNADQNDVHTTKKLKNYNNNSTEQSKMIVSCVKDVTNTTNANISNNFKPSIRKNSQQTVLNTSCSNQLDLKKSSNVQEELKSLNTQHNPEYSKKLINLNASECSFTLSNDQMDLKSIPQPNSSECDNSKPVIKSEKISKLVNKDYSRNTKVTTTTTITTSNSIRSSSTTSSVQHEKEDVETKESNKHHVITKDKDLPKCNSHNSVKKHSRPAVILMDESLSDSTKNKDDVPSELTFGFEINEQLLQSEDRTKKDQPILASKPSQSSNKVPIHFEKTPPSFVDKNTRYDFHVHPPPHLYPPQPHQIPHTQMIPITYFGYSPRFQPPNNYVSQPLIAPSNAITKYNLSKEDFSARFIAPEETVDVKNYNHDKIVSFVGLAWDAVMREIPVTEATGRVQYYSGQ